MRANADAGGKRDALTAIRLKCIDCMGNGPGARRLVETCKSTDCPLYPFRCMKALQEGRTEHTTAGQMTMFEEIGA